MGASVDEFRGYNTISRLRTVDSPSRPEIFVSDLVHAPQVRIQSVPRPGILPSPIII